MRTTQPRMNALGMALTLTLLFTFAPLVQATDPGRIAKADTVLVSVDGTEMRLGSKAVAELPKDAAIKVVEVAEEPKGSGQWWVGGSAEVDGETHQGWVHTREVYKKDAPGAVAELKKFKIRVENEYLGNVLRIDAEKSDLPGTALAHLKGLHHLEGLELSGTKVTNEDLRHLSGLTNLRWLYLDNTLVSDVGLIHLKGLVRLDVLALNKSQVRGPGLEHIKGLKALRVLNLSECKLDDASLEHIKGMGRIQTLALQETPITGNGLKFLKDMPRLNVLNLNHCKLRDGTLLNLKGAQELRILHLEKAQADQDSKDALEEAIDGLAIFD